MEVFLCLREIRMRSRKNWIVRSSRMHRSGKRERRSWIRIDWITRIELLTVIGEVEGHETAPSQSKTTKYEHVLPKLAMIEDDKEVEGLLILLNTVGGDVEAGLAIAEMIASLSIPTVSLVLGGGHSIGIPMAVSADYSFAVASATMVIHPVRSSGMFIGVAQTYRNMEKIQDRITGFIAAHSRASRERLEELMLDTSQLVKDVGTLLEGEEAVKEGLIDEVGGIREALMKLHQMIEADREKSGKIQKRLVFYRRQFHPFLVSVCLPL